MGNYPMLHMGNNPMLHMGNNPMLHIWATASKRRWTVAGSTQYDTTGPWKGWGTKREVQIFLKLQLVMYIANTKRDIANTKMHITNTKRGVDSSKKDTRGNDTKVVQVWSAHILGAVDPKETPRKSRTWLRKGRAGLTKWM